MVIDQLNKPYSDEPLTEISWIRTFDPTITESDEYVWHRDHEDRMITILEGEGWQFQFDEQVPKMINSSDKFEIPKHVYHRLIVGKTKLKIKIEKV